MNPCRNTRVGFSTTVLDRSISLDKLYELQTEVVEICGYSPEAWGKLRIDLSHADIPVGLHCPIPFAGWVKQFDITGQGEHRRAAFELVEMTLQAARLVNGAYVNVHFPSVVRRPADLCGLRQSGYLNSVMNSARELHALSEKYKVPVLLENVGPNPFFYKAEHFRAMFERVPGLRLCFDPGHIHVLPNGEDVYNFAEDLIAFIESVHIYGANPRTYRVGFHDPPLITHQPEDGWIDFPRLLGILARSQLRYLIFEYSADTSDDPAVHLGVARLRALWKTACQVNQ